ncbi:hypothetical protein M407DRAFT_242445 [Tulasnella calospora MUT 4182]|uniref:Uncharacterized protein n=1 Tax=Tulasnella calospora MUT 4182 TaxID=1051891 RepID=A0A0C3M8D3_9AGAM|nr:hypothetical protein M407DRAFT_242445 [Tulasnella calospora MUT 4182]
MILGTVWVEHSKEQAGTLNREQKERKKAFQHYGSSGTRAMETQPEHEKPAPYLSNFQRFLSQTYSEISTRLSFESTACHLET